MESPAQTPEVLTPFGKYLLDAELARGGMARVYLARLRGLGGFEKKLVVKQILPELASDPRFVTMFVEEAKTLVQMTHPHIVPVYELGIVDGVYFLAMEHIEGATLAEILRDGAVSPEIAAHIGAQVCDALSYAHERYNLVHRDITPRNVIVDAHGHARLLDFGIAAQSEGAEEEHVFGSHGYMSPEQARGQSVDGTSDLFALGAVLYEALSGVPAFLRDTTEETNNALIDEPLPVLSSEVPAVIAAIVHELLRREPSERPATAREAGERFRKFLAHARPEGAAPELGERADRARRARGRTPSGRPPAPDRAGSKSVRTIATSIELEKLLTPRPLRASVPVAAEGPQAGTAKIPGRKATPLAAPAAEAVASRRTKKRAGRGKRSRSSDALARPEGATAARTEVAEPASSGRRRVSIAAVLVAVAVGAVVVSQLGGETPIERAQPQERVASEPPPTRATEMRDPVEPAPLEATMMPPVEPTMENPMVETPPVIEEVGTLTINARPWARISVDGRVLGNGPIRGREVRAGSHRISFVLPDTGAQVSRTVNVARGAHVRVIANMNARPPTVSVE